MFVEVAVIQEFNKDIIGLKSRFRASKKLITRHISALIKSLTLLAGMIYIIAILNMLSGRGIFRDKITMRFVIK